MAFTPNINTYLNVLSLVSLAVVGFYVVRSKVKNENLKDLQDRVNILEGERAELRNLLTSERETANQQHLSNQKAISKLEGQVALYRDLQLTSISEHLSSLDESNKKILDTLKGSAVVAKEAQADGGLLVKTKETNPLDVKPVDK